MEICDGTIIEEIGGDELLNMPADELSEFQEVRPLEVIELVDTGGKEQSALIIKYMQGEGELSDLIPKLESNEYQDSENEVQIPIAINSTQTCIETNEFVVYQDEQPSSSSQFNHYPPRKTTARNINTSSSNMRRGILDPALKGLMGEANLAFAQNQLEKTEKICMEIIRQNPLAPEPFLTLAQIYENRNKEKYISFHTIAAHLMPHNLEQWIHVCKLYTDNGEFDKARLYYSKAIKIMPKCFDLRLLKVQLLERMGDKNNAMYTSLRMIPIVPDEQADFCLQTAKNVAQHFYNLSKHDLALMAMEFAYDKCRELFALEDLNLYLELLMLNKKYERVVSCLQERTNLQMETEDQKLEGIFCWAIPDDFVPDIRSKLCISLIHLGAFHLLDSIIVNIHQHIPLQNEAGIELYVDIAEALMQNQKYQETIHLLSPLINGETIMECPAFIWLRQAECLRLLNRTTDAIECYYRVLDMAPNCNEAKFTLSALLKQQGRHLEAVEALKQTHDSAQPLNARMLYERCVMLWDIGRIEEFLETGFVLLARHSIELRSRDEMMAASHGGNCYNVDAIKLIIQMRDLTDKKSDKALQNYNKPSSDDSNLSLQEEYDLFLKLINTAYTYAKYSVIQRICFAMVTAKRFMPHQHSLARIVMLACYFNDDCSIAFSYLRELISKNVENMSLWNMLSLIEQKSQESRYQRYIRRLLRRRPCPLQIRTFIGHYHMHSSSYKYALLYYMPVYRKLHDPLVTLCIAVIFNQLALQKKVMRKTAAVGQAVAFAQRYAELRQGIPLTESDECVTPVQQEIFYNFGRFYHQAGLNHLAVHYYERALAIEHKLLIQNEKYLGLRQEIAYNLHLIYKSSGNLDKARSLLYQHCKI